MNTNDIYESIPLEKRLYTLRALPQHLIESSQVWKLHRLLALETNEGLNYWYMAKQELGNIESYLADIALAKNFSEKNSQKDISLIDVNKSLIISPMGLEIHYALINASIRSLSSNIPSTMLGVLIEKKIWTPAQGLIYARQITSLGDRIEAFYKIIPHLSIFEKRDLLEDILSTCRKLSNPLQKVEEFIRISYQLSEEGKISILMEALDITKEAHNEWSHSHEFHANKDYLTEEPEGPLNIGQILSRALSKYDCDVAVCSIKIASLLPEPSKANILKETIESIQRIESKTVQVEALSSILPYLQEVERKAVLEVTLSISPIFPPTHNEVGGFSPRSWYSCFCFSSISPTRSDLPGCSKHSMTSSLSNRPGNV